MAKKYYSVNCHYDMVITVDVIAESEDEAIKLAKNKADYLSIDKWAECYGSSECIADEQELTDELQKQAEEQQAMFNEKDEEEQDKEPVKMNILIVAFDTEDMYEKAKKVFDSDGESIFWAGDWNDEQRSIEFAEAGDLGTLELALIAEMENLHLDGYHFKAETFDMEENEEHGKQIELDYDAGDVVTWHCDDDGQDHTSTITGITIEVNSEGEAEVTYKTEIEFKGGKMDAYFSEYDIVNK